MRYLTLILILCSSACLAKVDCKEYETTLYHKRQKTLAKFLEACEARKGTNCTFQAMKIQKTLYARDQERLKRAGCKP